MSSFNILAKYNKLNYIYLKYGGSKRKKPSDIKNVPKRIKHDTKKLFNINYIPLNIIKQQFNESKLYTNSSSNEHKYQDNLQKSSKRKKKEKKKETKYQIQTRSQTKLQQLSAPPKTRSQIKLQKSLQQLSTPRRTRIQTNLTQNSPMTNAIFNSESPSNKERLSKDLKKDNDWIQKQLDYLESKDPLYKYFEGLWGKIIEKWVAINIACPICKKKTLKMYKNNSFPIIDLVCINKEHKDGVKYWQVKTSKLGNKFQGFPYFKVNVSDNYISVGSRRWGENIHNIKPNGDNKDLLIGYILIIFTGNDQEITINKKKSYIIHPNLDIKKIDNENNWYYKYISEENDQHHKIQYNPETNTISSFFDLKHIMFNANIKIYYDPKLSVIDNPYNESLYQQQL